MTLAPNPPIYPRAADGFVPDPAHPYVPPAFQRLRANRLATRRPMRKEPRIVHYIGSLSAGGAERQLVNLITALSDRRLDVTLLGMEPFVGPKGFRLPAIEQHNIPFGCVEVGGDPGFSSLGGIPHLGELLAQVPNWLKPWPFEIARTLVVNPPDILHIWLDYTNITGAIAALMLGVPAIILSTRSVNPTHFSYMNVPWFQPWYAFLATIPDLLFLNNSAAGQQDYAQWMGVSPSRFQMIRNGIDADIYRPVGREPMAAFRGELGLAEDDQLLIGVFRLSDEKRPMMFLDVVEAVMKKHPRVHTAILGHGPMESELQSHIAQSPFRPRLHLLPPRTDMATVYSAAEVLLQTSVIEGTPNTLLEAQSTGCPVVTTRVGGAVEAFVEGETGFGADTVGELADRVSRIVGDRELRARLSESGRVFVVEKYGMGRMVDAYVELYDRLASTPL